MKFFGESSEEEDDIISKAKTREIVKVVLDYGITQPQIYHMIYLLSLELENVEHVKTLTSTLSDLNSSKSKSSIITKE